MVKVVYIDENGVEILDMRIGYYLTHIGMLKNMLYNTIVLLDDSGIIDKSDFHHNLRFESDGNVRTDDDSIGEAKRFNVMYGVASKGQISITENEGIDYAEYAKAGKIGNQKNPFTDLP